MKSSITKYIIGAIVVAVIAAYAIFSSNSQNNGQLAIIPPLPSLPSTSSSSSSGGSTASGSASSSGTGQYKDGTYTGSLADAFYGQLQVIAVIQGGKLSNITFPQYPSNPGHTIDESRTSLPVLAQEAVAAQSANVNIVSGATQTSQAFQQSLASALAQAH